ncbi:MFS transporter [Clostridium baratii]|uniref:MFS transporter n=1 Tax=Clostridium baratii TaxID=1561 RepID=UPI001C241F84|nr:MFS transporter [Clostridium baratii]
MEKKKSSFDIILAIILFSYFMILLDNSIIFTGTVKIAEGLHLNQRELSWISNAYSLTFGGFLLFGGRAGDLFGRKKMFSIGLVIFGVSSLFVGLSQSALLIIVSRAVQGIGSAILAPTTLAILMDNYKGEARTKAVAYYGATAGIGSSIGLVIGGIFASMLSWRYGFFINVPISIVMIILSKRFIKERDTKAGKIDYVGTFTSVIGMVALVYSIVGTYYRGYSLILAIIFIGAFIYQEATTKQPIMPLRLFADRERLGAYLARFLYLGAMVSFWFITPQIMQDRLGFTPLLAGVGFFPLTIISFVIALQIAKLTKRFGNTRLLVTGIFITLIGMILVSRFDPSYGYWIGIALPMVLLGIGQGLTLSPLTVAGIANTNAEDAGAASSVLNMFHQIGGSIGLAAVIAISSTVKNNIQSYHVAMFITSVFLFLALIFVVFLILPVKSRGFKK